MQLLLEVESVSLLLVVTHLLQVDVLVYMKYFPWAKCVLLSLLYLKKQTTKQHPNKNLGNQMEKNECEDTHKGVSSP